MRKSDFKSEWPYGVVVLLILNASFLSVRGSTPFQEKATCSSVTERNHQGRIDEALDTVRRRYLTVGVHTPWQIMHGILALGDRMDVRVARGSDRVQALRYLFNPGRFSQQAIFESASHGIRVKPSSDSQGHPDQFLAILAQKGFPLETVVNLNNGHGTIQEMITQAVAETGQHAETSWTIIALCHYLGPEAQWTNQDSRRYSIEGLMDWELRQSVQKGACGGTHRLYALTFALNRYLSLRKPLRGVWRRADEKIRQYVKMAKSFQNNDGSFSSEYFSAPGWTDRFEDRLYAHGHTLEWMAIAVDPNQLTETWLVRAVDFLSTELVSNRRQSIECGALYHAGHALNLYQERRWMSSD